MERKHPNGLGYALLVVMAVAAPASGPAWAEEVAGQAAPETLELEEARAAKASPEPGQPRGEWPVSFAFDATYASRYVWRGIVVTEDPVFEPSIEVGIGDVTLNVWANLDTTDVNDFDD